MLKRVGKLNNIQTAPTQNIYSKFTGLTEEAQRTIILKVLDGTEEAKEMALNLLSISKLRGSAFEFRVMFTDSIWKTKAEKKAAEEADKEARHREYMSKSAYERQKIEEAQYNKELFRINSNKYIELSHKKDKTIEDIEEMYYYFNLMYKDASSEEI